MEMKRHWLQNLRLFLAHKIAYVSLMKYIYRDYSPLYPKLFSREKIAIESRMNLLCKIEHVGSSAIEGLGGKPIIDILITSIEQNLKDISRALQDMGYTYRPEHSSPDHFFLKKRVYVDELFAYHVHLCEQESKNALAFVELRDYLRANPSKALRYAEIKRKAAVGSRGDGVSYRQQKEEFFSELESRLKTDFS